jgi:hypothetical protein
MWLPHVWLIYVLIQGEFCYSHCFPTEEDSVRLDMDSLPAFVRKLLEEEEKQQVANREAEIIISVPTLNLTTTAPPPVATTEGVIEMEETPLVDQAAPTHPFPTTEATRVDHFSNTTTLMATTPAGPKKTGRKKNQRNLEPVFSPTPSCPTATPLLDWQGICVMTPKALLVLVGLTGGRPRWNFTFIQ